MRISLHRFNWHPTILIDGYLHFMRRIFEFFMYIGDIANSSTNIYDSILSYTVSTVIYYQFSASLLHSTLAYTTIYEESVF